MLISTDRNCIYEKHICSIWPDRENFKGNYIWKIVKTNNIEGGGEDVCIAPSRVGVGGRR